MTNTTICFVRIRKLEWCLSIDAASNKDIPRSGGDVEKYYFTQRGQNEQGLNLAFGRRSSADVASHCRNAFRVR